ncbi:MAG: glutamine amidotransferase-related protein, partial [Legionella sp.]
NKETSHPVLGLINDWLDADGSKQVRDENTDLGGTMRLGAQMCNLEDGTLARKVYGNAQIIERHRHRYEVNNRYVDELVAGGLIISGRSADNTLVEMVELADHPWFLASQFHPEFTSNPRMSHPLFKEFILAARQRHEQKDKK